MTVETVEGVFAAGDVAEDNDKVLGLWPIAAKQLRWLPSTPSVATNS
jgi:hypothetical protein